MGKCYRTQVLPPHPDRKTRETTKSLGHCSSLTRKSLKPECSDRVFRRHQSTDMEQLPGDVERLQQQLTDQKISTDEFFAMLLSTYELETSKDFLKSIIGNLKSLATTTAWGGRYKEIQGDLVEIYEDFFCETIVDNEDIFWSDNEENLVEGDIGKLDLGTSDEFDDDKSGNPAEAALAFKLSLAEVDVEQKLSSKAGELPTSTTSAESSKNRRK